MSCFFFFQAEDGIRDYKVTGVQTCALPISTNGTIAYPLPLVLGHEGAGIVTAVGEGVSRYAIGDHVVSSFVSICGRCHYCQTGRPQLCVQSLQALYTLPDGSVRTFDAAGSPLNVFCGCGVMAEYATLHADNLVKIDRQMPLDRAARSEEHTSELQSPCNLVCRLLLEKKNKTC